MAERLPASQDVSSMELDEAKLLVFKSQWAGSVVLPVSIEALVTALDVGIGD
jgi:hypothetical protein